MHVIIIMALHNLYKVNISSVISDRLSIDLDNNIISIGKPQNSHIGTPLTYVHTHMHTYIHTHRQTNKQTHMYTITNTYSYNDTHTHIMVANIVDMSPSGHSEILNAEYTIIKEMQYTFY